MDCKLCSIIAEKKEVYFETEEIIILKHEDTVIAAMKEHIAEIPPGKASGIIKATIYALHKNQPNKRYSIGKSEYDGHHSVSVTLK